MLIGGLHLGSTDPTRYDSSSGTVPGPSGAIAAISIESTLNRERLRIAGMTDALTGLHNRRYFDHRSQIELSQALRHRAPPGLFIDVDHLKQVSDTHGHSAGDQVVLRQVGRLIQQMLRSGDWRPAMAARSSCCCRARRSEARWRWPSASAWPWPGAILDSPTPRARRSPSAWLSCQLAAQATGPAPDQCRRRCALRGQRRAATAA